MLTASETEAYLTCPDVDSVREFLQNAFKLKEKGESFQYGHIVEQLKTRDDTELLWRLYVALSSCIVQLTQRPDLHRELIQALFTYGWSLEDKVSAAFTHLLGLLVSANPVFVIPVFQVVIKNFVSTDYSQMQMSPGDLSLSANTSSSRSHWLHATLKGVVALAPAGQSELCAVLADFFPYKLMPAAVQQQYVSQLLTVCQYLPHFQPKILELIISKCLEIDVDIVIEEGGVAEFLEGQGKEEEEEEEDPSGLLFDLDDEDEEDQPGHSSSSITELHFLNGGADAAHSKRRVVRSLWATSSSGVFEAYCGGSSSSFSHRIGADVAEMADKLDAMLALLMNYISTQFAANEATRERLFFQLLGTFEKIVLTVHRAKFVQFIMFYMCAKHQPYAVLFARRLLEIFADPQQSASGSAVRRQSAVMYLASFLSRLAALPPAIIREILLEVFLWCDAYTTQALGLSPSRGDAAAVAFFPEAGSEGFKSNEELSLLVCDENGHTHLRHETLYVAVQALCYVLCFYGRDLWLSLLAADTLGPVRIRRVLLSPLLPLRFCAPAVRSEFISLVGRCESVSAAACGGEGCTLTALELHEADMSGANANSNSGGGSGSGLVGSTGVKLESFFPFDPCLLTTIHAFVAQFYQEWSDVSADGLDTKFTDAQLSSELWQVEESLGSGGGHVGARHWSISTASECSESVMSSYDSSMLSALITTYQEVLTSGQLLEPTAEAKLLRAVVTRPAHSAAPEASSADPSPALLATPLSTSNPAQATKTPSSSTSRRRLRARLGEETEASCASSSTGLYPKLGNTAMGIPGVPPPSQAEIDQMYARLIGAQTTFAGMGRQHEETALHSRAAAGPRGLAFAGSKSSSNLALVGSGTFGQLGGLVYASSKPPILTAGLSSLIPPQSGPTTPLLDSSASSALGLKDFQKRAREYSVGSVGSW